MDYSPVLHMCRLFVQTQEAPKSLQSICSLLWTTVHHYNWVGFYIVDATGQYLDLGPYSGAPTEHTRIAFGRGICGQAAATGKAFVVDDVSKETNYLACSLAVKSEIVLPIFAPGCNNKVVAELDIDSHTLGAFTPEDRAFLERLCGMVGFLFTARPSDAI
jgi:GAF domain-containing protein